MSTRVQWRFYDHARDCMDVLRLHRELEEKIGRTLDLPNLDQRPVLATVVGETNGELTHGMFVEAEAEVCAIGGNPLPATSARQAANLLLPVLDYYKIRIARSFVPTALLAEKDGREAPIGRLLRKMQFTEDSKNMTHFFRWLGGE